MLSNESMQIIEASRGRGWVLEPDAKRLFSLEGLPVPRFALAHTAEEALDEAAKIGFPVVAKVVSPEVLHKSDVGGVMANIKTGEELRGAFQRFSGLKGFEGMLVEERVSGIELIVGGSVDFQFGPVILLGLGGTAVEVYKDTSIRLAPLRPGDVQAMVAQLTAHPLLEGYRGADPIDMGSLTRLLVRFSEVVMDLEDLIESIDLNPVMCKGERCIIADARIMLAKG